MNTLNVAILGSTEKEPNLLQLCPVQPNVLTNTTNSSQMYVLSMTFDDDQNENAVQTDNAEVSKSIEILEKNINYEKVKLQEPQRTSTPTFEDTSIGNFNDTILDGHLQEPQQDRPPLNNDITVHPQNKENERIATVLQHKQLDVDRKKTEENCVQISPIRKDELMQTTTSPLQLKTEQTDKEKKNTDYKSDSKETVENAPNIHKQSMKQTVADMFETNASTNNSSTNYCRDWLSRNNGCDSKDIAQNDTYVKQDSCDSELLENVTSVSKWVAPKTSKNKKQVAKIVKSKESKEM